MKLSLDQLTAVCPRLGRAKASHYLPHLNAALDEFDINTERRIECWLAQNAHESVEFTQIIENMNYSAKRLLQVFPKYFRGNPGLATEIAHDPRRIANHVYGSRMGNRAGTDDGFNMRGRTPTHLTGRSGYTAAGKGLGIDLLTDPDTANLPENMFRISCWFWKANGLNELADRGDFRALTKRLNGGYVGMDSRLAYWARAKRVIDDREPDEPLALLGESDDEDDDTTSIHTADALPLLSDPAEPAHETPGNADATSLASPVGDVASPPAPAPTEVTVEAGGVAVVEAAASTTAQTAVAPVPGGSKDDVPVQVTTDFWSKAKSIPSKVYGLITAGTITSYGWLADTYGWFKQNKEVLYFTLIVAAVIGLYLMRTRNQKALLEQKQRFELDMERLRIQSDPNRINSR